MEQVYNKGWVCIYFVYIVTNSASQILDTLLLWVF
jgi:hypothetical protein